MANILYGVAGEGSGHAARAIEVIRHLIGRGHKVVVLSHDRGFSYLEGSCDVRTIFGLQLAYKEQKIQYRKTLLKNITKIPEA
ncbi:MAG: glycosyltransferase family protein, partial [bacterium]|nr:glycosyltransferase family protein [bacterium]